MGGGNFWPVLTFDLQAINKQLRNEKARKGRGKYAETLYGKLFGVI
jgi:hypothetical protein